MQIVVVAIVIKDRDILLIRRIDKEPGLDWCCPGGRLEPGETEEQAIVREVFEETGCNIRPVRKMGVQPHPLRSDMVLSYWHCDYVDGEARIIEPDRHEAVEWKSLVEAEKLVERDWTPFIQEFFVAYS